MKVNEQARQLLRASKLSELAGVPIPTIKHYVNEGLIPQPMKTGKTMAYYDPACVDRIKLIKRLQKEQFLPLDVIKRVLDSGAAYEEELQVGQAILKSHKAASLSKMVPEQSIERRSHYPMRKVRLLEKEGLIMPSKKDGSRFYDAADLKVIEIMKRREELGVPFDHSIETLRLYKEAIRGAVGRDIRLFAKNLLGGFPSEQTVSFLTEVDDSLDSFIILIRQKLLRRLGGEAISQMNELSKKLAMLSFTLPGAYLPEDEPEEFIPRLLYFFCSGRQASVAEFVESLPETDASKYAAAAVIAHVLRKDFTAALSLVSRQFPKPDGRVLNDAAAALAYMVSVGETSGFTGPSNLVRKALAHLREIERARMKNNVADLIGGYICGAIYVLLPDMFDTLERGIDMLERVKRRLRDRRMQIGRIPPWLEETVQFEIIPAMTIRVNRFLAEAYLRRGDCERAEQCLAAIIEIAEPCDEHSQWARIKKIEIRNMPVH
ncbi:MAG: MerR family transcriptional regulator [Candidatus Abyssobacteria bacterium SURF_5]|uniref:MerR family transcriptional regulator n=1 Tax=Abyssobacteria bacterium (strain SURF_5) TaxID=2093360 RepID=A0A3A4NKY2_ABYX5|nr:MAG: MerR family transcriptional regulator [Candidatus Abyssubacteria bacterium SURF_5]